MAVSENMYLIQFKRSDSSLKKYIKYLRQFHFKSYLDVI